MIWAYNAKAVYESITSFKDNFRVTSFQVLLKVYSGDVWLFHKLIIINSKIILLNKFLEAQFFSDYIDFKFQHHAGILIN